MRILTHSEAMEMEQLARYVGEFATLVWGINSSDPVHPSVVLSRELASATPRQRLAGLRQATNDTISAAGSMSHEQLAHFDALLAQRRALTISQVRLRYSGELRKILSSRKLRNEDEFHLAKGALEDSALPLTEPEKAVLSGLVEQFELKDRA